MQRDTIQTFSHQGETDAPRLQKRLIDRQPRKFTASGRTRHQTARRRELIAALGHEPNVFERFLVGRICQNEWLLLRLDRQLEADGALPDAAQRARDVAESRLREDLLQLGMRPAGAAA
jgi:hypothetical protein